MARRKRSDLFVPSESAIVHVMNRTNHGIYLFGIDPVTKRDCNHRKEWMEQRLQLHAACFAIDLLGFSILSNHFHQVLRSRPDLVARWCDREVARRWLTLCPEERDERGIPLAPTKEQIDRLCRQKDRIKEIRTRLSDISWWMRLFNQMVAQWVNREEGLTGHLWQGRFKAVRLVDEVSLLACMVYVDLNPIRAALVESLEASQFTSAYHRILSLEELKSRSAELEREQASLSSTSTEASAGSTISAIETEGGDGSIPASQQAQPKRGIRGYCESMIHCLAPVALAQSDRVADAVSRCPGLRCDDKGFLAMTAAEYIALLDWTARQIRIGSAGSTPSEFAPIFERLGISTEIWIKLVRGFRKYFGEIAGKASEVQGHTESNNRQPRRLPKQTREMLS